MPYDKAATGAAAAGGGAVEEVGEEVVEDAAAASEPACHPLLREVDLTEILDLLGPGRLRGDRSTTALSLSSRSTRPSRNSWR